jgi:hypothetical protein
LIEKLNLATLDKYLFDGQQSEGEDEEIPCPNDNFLS